MRKMVCPGLVVPVDHVCKASCPGLVVSVAFFLSIFFVSPVFSFGHFSFCLIIVNLN